MYSTRSIDIALFMKSLASGGAERVMLNLAAGFTARGRAVDLVVCESMGPLREFLHPDVRLIDLSGGRVSQSVLPLVRYLRRVRPASLLSTLLHTNIAAAWARKVSGVDLRLVLRADTVRRPHLARLSRIERLAMPWLIRRCYGGADSVVCVSKDVADDVASFGVHRELLTLVPNPIVTPELLQRSLEPLQHPWFAPDCPPVVLGVGRLTVQKRFDLLIEAFSRLRRRRDARLMILGTGESESSLRNQAQELGLEHEVAFEGWVSNPLPYMARAGLLAQSSDYEGLPGVLVEALAVGCPVVSTDAPGGAREILRGGELGPLVPTGDAAALASAMEHILSAPPDRSRLRAGARPYEAGTNIDRYLALVDPTGPATRSCVS